MSDTYIVMGVSGCGKSTVGRLLADALNLPFFDGDDFHPQANIDKMSQGTPLNDQDRAPWLEILAELPTQHGACVIACSALKKSYRDILRTKQTTFVFLEGSKDLLLSRLQTRASTSDHFMPTALLESQLETLENPGNEDQTFTFDIDRTAEEIVSQLIQQSTNHH